MKRLILSTGFTILEFFLRPTWRENVIIFILYGLNIAISIVILAFWGFNFLHIIASSFVSSLILYVGYNFDLEEEDLKIKEFIASGIFSSVILLLYSIMQ